MSNVHILKNLYSLIRNSSLSYMNEFVWQDIELTNEFKNAYKAYLNNNRYDIEFLGATAVITSSSTKYIYVPNQWFVIASYAVDVYEELQKYKDYFKKISDALGKHTDEYAKLLRDGAPLTEKNAFIDCAEKMFSQLYFDPDMVDESVSRLWRFVSDYSWWSGQKTIDRGDFHLSVILNMLNLVNASQSYVADIVSAYSNDHTLRKLVTSTDGFTTNMESPESDTYRQYYISDEEIRNHNIIAGDITQHDSFPHPERVRIKIDDKNVLKEIKYNG